MSALQTYKQEVLKLREENKHLKDRLEFFEKAAKLAAQQVDCMDRVEYHTLTLKLIDALKACELLLYST